MDLEVKQKLFFFLKIKIQAPRNGGKNTVFHQQLLAAFTHSMDGPILWLCRKQWEAAATFGTVKKSQLKPLDSEGRQ